MSNPVGVAIHPGGDIAYVTEISSPSRLAAVDLTTGAITRVTQQLAAIPLFLASVNGEQQPVSGEAEAGRAQSRPDPMPTAGEISLPLAVKRALQEYGRMSAVEIREAVIRAGVPREKLGAGGSYLYTVLGRLDQRGHIERHRGRYFLVPGVAIEETK